LPASPRSPASLNLCKMNQHRHDQPISDLCLTAPHDQHGHYELDGHDQQTSRHYELCENK
jgi:hypothetical protein